MSYLVTIRYKNGEAVIFESPSNTVPLRFPEPITEYTNVPNPSSPSYAPTVTSSTKMVLCPVPMMQKWDNRWINVYEVLDITIEGDND